jgi:hypothetical protein
VTTGTGVTAVCEAFANEYPEKEVLNKTTVHQLVTKLQVHDCLQECGGYVQQLL